jgi:hypothetical protein
MPVESASDLASLFDEDEFAEAAEYTAPGGGAAIACTVIVDRGQGRERFVAGEAVSVGSERHLWVRQAELAVVARGGTFTMLDAEGEPTGEEFTVQGPPQLDHTGALWSVELLIVED